MVYGICETAILLGFAHDIRYPMVRVARQEDSHSVTASRTLPEGEAKAGSDLDVLPRLAWHESALTRLLVGKMVATNEFSSVPPAPFGQLREPLSDSLPCPPRTISNSHSSFDGSISRSGRSHEHSLSSLSRPLHSSVDNPSSRNARHTELSLSQPSGSQRLPPAPHVSLGLDSTSRRTTENKLADRQAVLSQTNRRATGAMDDNKTQTRLQNPARQSISRKDSSPSHQAASFLEDSRRSKAT